MANQYEVLGKAPTPEDLKKLSPNNIHLTTMLANCNVSTPLTFPEHNMIPMLACIIKNTGF